MDDSRRLDAFEEVLGRVSDWDTITPQDLLELYKEKEKIYKSSPDAKPLETWQMEENHRLKSRDEYIGFLFGCWVSPALKRGESLEEITDYLIEYEGAELHRHGKISRQELLDYSNEILTASQTIENPNPDHATTLEA